MARMTPRRLLLQAAVAYIADVDCRLAVQRGLEAAVDALAGYGETGPMVVGYYLGALEARSPLAHDRLLTEAQRAARAYRAQIASNNMAVARAAGPGDEISIEGAIADRPWELRATIVEVQPHQLGYLIHYTQGAQRAGDVALLIQQEVHAIQANSGLQRIILLSDEMMERQSKRGAPWMVHLRWQEREATT